VQGYRRIRVLGKLYWAHRLAWLYVHGDWPPDKIDHINGDRKDNRLMNLRAASDSENMQNVGMRSDNTTGVRGVTRRKSRWIAQITAGGKTHYLGVHETAEEAHRAYVEAKTRLHPFNPVLRATV
jgi:hypothetical protein